ncbi:hypothetical protein B0H13DRAFT_2382898 [Mycena leptocephala]|nr:hypothetical protein B0H13DRAFT_2382898 [Mycena leptocephala]
MAWSCPGLPDVRLAEEAYGSMVRVFSSTLGGYQNLRFLSLRSLTIDTPLREALRNLGQLKGLVLHSCDVSSSTETVLALEEFTVGSCVGPKDPKPLHIVSPETLRALHIDGRLYSSALLSGFAEDSKTFSNLVSLTVELWEAFVPQLLAFLERCSQLTHLEISKSGLTCAPTGHLAPAIIPLLRSFKGPCVLGVFVGFQRPIEVIELSGGSGVKSPKKEDIIGDLAQLAHSCPGVRSLSLTVTFPDCPKITGAIAKHWPELRELSMELKRLRESGIPGFDDSDADGDDDTESGSDDMMGGPIIGMWGEDDSSGWDSGEELELEGGLYEANIDPADLERQLLGAGELDLCDDGRLKSSGSPRASCAALPTDSDDTAPLTFPDVLEPGHLYTASGHASPPKTTPSALVPGDPTSLPTLIDHLAAGRLSFPPTLTSLRLLRSTLLAIVSHRPPIALDQQHRVILALEAQLPALREIEFETSHSRATRLLERRIWRREVEGGTWCLNLSEGGTKIASLVGRES